MNKHNQDGAISALLIPLILACVLLVGAIVFGYWAFDQRQDYKNNVDQKIAVATANAKRQESEAKDKVFAEEAKNPLRTYNGPSQFGSIVLQYPKTWSAYVDTSSNSSGLDGYFEPATVPSVGDVTNNFALRVQVVQQAYSDVLASFANLPGISTTPYTLPKLPNVIGVKITGAIESQKTGTMIILPLRSSTLKIFTESADNLADFNNIILPNFSFSP